MDKKNLRTGLAIGMVLLLGIFLVYAFWPYTNALFGALVLYVLFAPIYDWLVSKTKVKSLSAVIIIILTLVIVILPIFFITSLIVNEVEDMVDRADDMIRDFETIEFIDQYLDPYLDDFSVEGFFRDLISELGDRLAGYLWLVIDKATFFIFNIIIMYFLLFYLLVSGKQVKKVAYEIIPFNNKNSGLLLKEFKKVTNSVVIATGLIALFQGFFLGLVFYIFGVTGAVLWGFIGFILSFLPVLGIPILWIPAGLIMLLIGEPVSGIGILIAGFFLSNVYNIIRVVIQKRIGRIHPLVTLVGVFIGIPVFGMLGIIIGPLLLSYFFLSLKMFKEEYIEGKETSSLDCLVKEPPKHTRLRYFLK
ncbi:MAG: AI-2E family transporter [Nanoarchaeota archaeon]